LPGIGHRHHQLFIVLFLEPTLFIYYNRGAFSFLFINFLFIITLHVIGSGLIIYREIMVEKKKPSEPKETLRIKWK